MSGPPPFLIISVIVMALLLLGAVIMMVIIFGHPDDKNTAWFPKIITIFGLWLAFASLLVMPYDVASKGENVRVDILWQIIYIILIILVSAIIPFAIFYYESEIDPEEQVEGFFETQIGMGLKYTFFFLVFFFLLMGLMFVFLGTANIPVTRYVVNNAFLLPYNTSNNYYKRLYDGFNSGTGSYTLCTGKCGCGCAYSNIVWSIPVSFPLYVMAFMSFVGWFFFATFAGVGFVALPMDLINEFRTRPTPISTRTYFEERQKLGTRAAMLIEVGEKMKNLHESARSGSQRKGDRRDLLAFEKHYYNLKKDYQVLYIAHKLRGGNPLEYFAKLVVGLFCIVLSVCWYVQVRQTTKQISNFVLCLVTK